MATGNEVLVHKCFPKHSHMGAARMKYDKETDELKKRGVSVERSTAGMSKIEVPTAYHILIKNQQ